ncbi:ABC transporter substrate-binding protein [Chloroflexota bacterium]
MVRRKILWLGLSFLLVASLVLSSCGPAAPGEQEEEEEGAPKPEGSVVVSVESLGEEGFLVPRLQGNDSTQMWELVYDSVFWQSEATGQVIPGLAERWEFTADAKTITLYLREGIPWWDDWGEVTAEDIKYTLERTAEEGSTGNGTPRAREIESMDVIDPYTLVIKLKEPNPVYLQYLNAMTPYYVVMCKEYVETVGDDEAFRNPIGSGPYRLTELSSGSYAKFEAFDEHWRLVPEFKEMTLQIVPEETTRVAMLRTGQIDTAMVNANQIAALRAEGFSVDPSGGGAIIIISFGGMYIPGMDGYVEGLSYQDPWGDIRVREAMNIAIDRDALNQGILAGTGLPVASWSAWAGGLDVEPYTYDPEKARQLLDDAGYSDGFNFQIYSMSRTPGMALLTEAAAGYWAEIGLTTEIIPIDYNGFKERFWVPRKTHGMVWPWRNSSGGDETTSFKNMFDVGSQRPTTVDAELITMIDDMIIETDMDIRQEKWEACLDYEREHFMNIPLVMERIGYAKSDKVGEWPHSLGTYPYYFAYMRHAEPLNTFRLFTPGN